MFYKLCRSFSKPCRVVKFQKQHTMKLCYCENQGLFHLTEALTGAGQCFGWWLSTKSNCRSFMSNTALHYFTLTTQSFFKRSSIGYRLIFGTKFSKQIAGIRNDLSSLASFGCGILTNESTFSGSDLTPSTLMMTPKYRISDL